MGPGDHFHKAGLWRVIKKYPGKARKTQCGRAMRAAEGEREREVGAEHR